MKKPTNVKLAINELFAQAKDNPKSAKNLVNKARNLSLHYKVPFTKAQKMHYCKSCGHFLSTPRTRIKNKKIIVRCKYCNSTVRIGMKIRR